MHGKENTKFMRMIASGVWGMNLGRQLYLPNKLTG